MKSFKVKMLVMTLLAIVSIGAASSYAMGSTPVEMACSLMQPEGIQTAMYNIAPAALAIAPLGAVVLPTFDLSGLTVITKEEFKQLQAKHGKLYILDICVDEGESYQYIAKRPSRQLLSAIADSRDDLNKANDLILKNMLLAGNMEAIDDGVVYAQVMQELAKIIGQGQSFLSKA